MFFLLFKSKECLGYYWSYIQDFVHNKYYAHALYVFYSYIFIADITLTWGCLWTNSNFEKKKKKKEVFLYTTLWTNIWEKIKECTTAFKHYTSTQDIRGNQRTIVLSAVVLIVYEHSSLLNSCKSLCHICRDIATNHRSEKCYVWLQFFFFTTLCK